MDKLQYKKENDELVSYILNERFFNIFRAGPCDDADGLWSGTQLELFLDSKCNQKCEYCYLVKYEGLYPKDIQCEDNIIRNVEILMDWLIDEGMSIHTIDIFSGEAFNRDLGYIIFDILKDAIDRGFSLTKITVPTNCSWAATDEGIDRMNRYVEDFEIRNTRLCISCSVDGLLVEDISRPMNNSNIVRDQAFYDRLFQFCKKHTFYFHPMVSACNVHKWIENHKWWENMCKSIGWGMEEAVMMLEVRNADWDDESINHLLEFYDYQMQRDIDICERDMDKAFLRLIGMGTGDCYTNYTLHRGITNPPCTVSDCIFIRCGDLAIVPCHRTSYQQFNYGKFVVENDKIVGIEGTNPYTAMKILLQNHNNAIHGCDTCPYNSLCMKQCYGAMYEASGEIFMPEPVVCKLFRAKIDHIIDKYFELGVIERLANCKGPEYYNFFKYLLDCISDIEEYRNRDNCDSEVAKC